jgi:hypothetical protein
MAAFVGSEADRELTVWRKRARGTGLTRSGGGSAVFQERCICWMGWTTLPAASRRGFGAPKLAISSPTVHR